MIKKDLIRLSKTLSYALRHAPWEYELELDAEGWVLVSNVLKSLAQEKPYWAHISIEDLYAVIAQSEKKRLEIHNNKIRALYGHSTPTKLLKEKKVPPEILYHGTNVALLDYILREGLRPMSRHYVHLSLDVETAQQVGSRKCSQPVILAINANEAHKNNVIFYEGNDKVWLADEVPVIYLKKYLD